jgi:uncharacterized protein
MKPRWLAVPFGLSFGFLLSWGGMTDPERIRAMLLLRELDIFLMMGAAMGTAMAGAHLLRAVKARTLFGGELITWTRTSPARHHLVGSALFGLGWSIACTCPGPIAAQLGQGRFAALWVVIGLVGGLRLHAWQHESRARREAPAAPATAGL